MLHTVQVPVAHKPSRHMPLAFSSITSINITCRTRSVQSGMFGLLHPSRTTCHRGALCRALVPATGTSRLLCCTHPRQHRCQHRRCCFCRWAMKGPVAVVRRPTRCAPCLDEAPRASETRWHGASGASPYASALQFRSSDRKGNTCTVDSKCTYGNWLMEGRGDWGGRGVYKSNTNYTGHVHGVCTGEKGSPLQHHRNVQMCATQAKPHISFVTQAMPRTRHKQCFTPDASNASHHIICPLRSWLSSKVRSISRYKGDPFHSNSLTRFLAVCVKECGGIREANVAWGVSVVRRPQRVRPHRKVGHPLRSKSWFAVVSLRESFYLH